MAALGGPYRGLAVHGFSAVQIFSGRSRQRGAADQGGLICARRTHLSAHGAWEILLHFGDAGQRHSAGTRGPLGTSRSGHRIAAWTLARAEPGKNQGAHSGGSGSGGRKKGAQYTCWSAASALTTPSGPSHIPD